MYAFTEDLKKLIKIALLVGNKTKEDLTNEIYYQLEQLKSNKPDDMANNIIKNIKVSDDKVLYTKKSPINYRWIIPDG